MKKKYITIRVVIYGRHDRHFVVVVVVADEKKKGKEKYIETKKKKKLKIAFQSKF